MREQVAPLLANPVRQRRASAVAATQANSQVASVLNEEDDTPLYNPVLIVWIISKICRKYCCRASPGAEAPILRSGVHPRRLPLPPAPLVPWPQPPAIQINATNIQMLNTGTVTTAAAAAPVLAESEVLDAEVPVALWTSQGSSWMESPKTWIPLLGGQLIKSFH